MWDETLARLQHQAIQPVRRQGTTHRLRSRHNADLAAGAQTLLLGLLEKLHSRRVKHTDLAEIQKNPVVTFSIEDLEGGLQGMACGQIKFTSKAQERRNPVFGCRDVEPGGTGHLWKISSHDSVAFGAVSVTQN
jgi:hypothetical protein